MNLDFYDEENEENEMEDDWGMNSDETEENTDEDSMNDPDSGNNESDDMNSWNRLNSEIVNQQGYELRSIVGE
jgi:hypothetical protein